ncbi:helix-turn-helix domain-containing protein [Oenococcus sp.]|uniref:helix-turn-helix domain-containing protein n=1 Tax=Oenococcus sp. TaxID=1979414 RepID=UPI0039E81969
MTERMSKMRYTKARLAREMHISPSAITLKFKNERGFSQSDVITIANILEIPPRDFGKYFFAQSINDK